MLLENTTETGVLTAQQGRSPRHGATVMGEASVGAERINRNRSHVLNLVSHTRTNDFGSGGKNP